mmetsp:Transcript_8519/g.21895  ORF Transcript_8519/g.21895 Transcript_8519/m.21895 type:complete len:279 (-) Transcript_8519:59-895(-)
MNSIPASATGSPTIPISKSDISNDGSFSFTKPNTTRLVDVPISVHVPPKIEAKLSGISSFEGENWFTLANPTMTGIIIATTGVLFMNADSTVTGTMKRIRMAVSGCCPPSPLRPSSPLIGLIAPVFLTASATTRRMATVSIPVLLNPCTDSSSEMIPATSMMTTVPIMSMSAPAHSRLIATSIATTHDSVTPICHGAPVSPDPPTEASVSLMHRQDPLGMVISLRRADPNVPKPSFWTSLSTPHTSPPFPTKANPLVTKSCNRGLGNFEGAWWCASTV